MVEVSREDILALTPFKVLDKISGTPMSANMIELWKQLMANLISVDYPLGQNKVQLGLPKDPATFTAQNGGPYDPPSQQPLMYPNIQNITSTSDHKNMRAKIIEDQLNQKNYKQTTGKTTSTSSSLA